MNESAVLLATDVAWPAAVLIIAVLLLATQRKAIGRLLDRAKSLKYPGGEAQLSNAVPEAGAETFQVLVDILSRNLGELTDREEAPVLAVEGIAAEVIQNREPLADLEPLPIGGATDLVALRANVANLLSEIAFPPPPGGFGPVSATIDTLVGRGVLDTVQAKALRDVVNLADQAAGGALVPPRVAIAVENSGKAILAQLDLLRTVAAARFEEHVLETLQRQIPPTWSMAIDRVIVSQDVPDETLHAGNLMRPSLARVDALITAGEEIAVVEVRAQLRPGAVLQIEYVRKLMQALPTQLPVLLVLLGEGLAPRELEEIREGHEGPVEFLQWDLYSGSLVPVLRDLLRSPQASPTLELA